MSQVLGQHTLQRLAGHRPRILQLLFFLCGALTMLSFAPLGWFPVAPLLLLPLLLSALCSTPRTAAKHGFWFGSGLFLTGTYWLYISIHVFGNAPLWVAITIMLVLVMIMGLYYALTCWLINRLAAGSLVRLLAAAPAVWVAVEWLRGWFLSGFPWMSLGYGQIDSPLAGFAPVIGVYGVSAMLLASVSALLVAIVGSGKLRAWCAAGALLPWLAGVALQFADWTAVSGPALRTTIVQGGVSQDRKWLREQYWPTLNLYRDSIATHPDSDLLVWPEVALPATIDQVEGYLQQLEQEMRSSGRSLMLGVLERDLDAGTIYNSMLMLHSGGRQLYRKRHLVPFGEYFPVPQFVRSWMRMMSLPNTDLNAGAARQALLSTAGGLKLSVAICYEDAYGAEQLYGLAQADILINVSNDAWFGDSIAPHQHLEIARMRALEAGRNVVRSTNNGISAFIGPHGEVLESGAQFEYVVMTRDVEPRSGLTPYARLGNWPVVLSCLLLMGGLYVRIRFLAKSADP